MLGSNAADALHKGGSMNSKRARALSLKDSRRVYEEMARPPEDTLERREMFEHVRAMAALRRKQASASGAMVKT